MVCMNFDLSRGILLDYAANTEFCELWATGNVKIYEYTLIIKNIFVHHENFAKYCGTSPWFTPPQYPAFKNERSLHVYSNSRITIFRAPLCARIKYCANYRPRKLVNLPKFRNFIVRAIHVPRSTIFCAEGYLCKALFITIIKRNRFSTIRSGAFDWLTSTSLLTWTSFA